jgi:hypothetical protein
MRLRLLRRRLTISAPRVAVRSAMPWPLRWLAVAVLLGFCGAVALWAFEFGKSIAGLDTVSQDELLQLRAEVARLREQEQQLQTTAHTAESTLVAERAVREGLLGQVKQLEADNRVLREDLGFFEKLMPATATEGLGIRSLQAEVLAGMQLRWHVLVIQSSRNAPEFQGRLELVLAGTRNDQPWSQTIPGHSQPLQVKQYRRVEGLVSLPPNAVVKTVTARVLDDVSVRATQSMTLE